jgi:CheY-like chemotaxis protein
VFAVLPKPVRTRKVELPFLVAARRAVRRTPGQQPEKDDRWCCVSHNILIVDDNAFIRQSLRACIEQNTDLWVCGEAENGAVALEKIKELKPDIVILDLHMPVMNGLEAARQIRLIAPRTLMIMVTMHYDTQLLEDARDAGITDVLPKCGGVAVRLTTLLKDFSTRP